MIINKLFGDVAGPEGPIPVGPSSWVIVEMDSGDITRLGPGGDDRTVLGRTGRPNGLAIGSDGAIWIAESLDPSLMRLDPKSSEPAVVTATASGEPLLWPNDLCIGPDGLIYFTDSGIEIAAFEQYTPSSRHRFQLDGRVVVFDPESGQARILDRGLQFANGIAIGPDGETLYVAETLTGLIHRYPLHDVAAETREVFADVLANPPESYAAIAGPDGFAFDRDGTLLVAVLTQGTLTTISPQGTVLEHLRLPDSFPTNLAFGGTEQRQVLVTGCETRSLYALEWPISGLVLHSVTSDLPSRLGRDVSEVSATDRA